MNVRIVVVDVVGADGVHSVVRGAVTEPAIRSGRCRATGRHASRQARDAALAGSDPLVRNGWIYGYDAEAAVPYAAEP